MTETPHQRRTRQLADIVLICDLADERELRQRLESLTEMQADLVHRLLMRVNGAVGYWEGEDVEKGRWVR